MGNITEKCCSNITCRISIIGPDSAGKKRLFEKLTNTTIDELNIGHYEVKTTVHGIRMMLCNPVGAENIPNAAKTQAEHSDGVIYIIDYEDKDNFKRAVSEFDHQYQCMSNKGQCKMLVLVNNAVGVAPEKLKVLHEIEKEDSNVSVKTCDLKEWKEVDLGMKWLCKNVRAADY
ncbi:ADP-ribosylation factor-like protein 4C [Gurleya vavrai]